MVDFRETRSSVARWKEVLVPVYKELTNLGAGDVWVYGSQAMSLYMKRPLTSKDLDLLATGMTIDIAKELCKRLAPLSDLKNPYFTFQNLERENKPNPVFSIYLSSRNERPFAVELFQTYNGHDLRELTPYVNYLERWKNEFQTLTVEGIIGTRLAFRPPDRISPFNAERLNRFIETVRDKIDWSKVEEFSRNFELQGKISENLKVLSGHGIRIIDSNKLSFLSREPPSGNADRK